MNLACLFLFWVASKELSTPKRLTIFLWVIFLSGLAVSIEALCQKYLGRGIIFRLQNYPVGTIGNTNYLGCYLLFPIFAGLALPRARYFLPILIWTLIISRARASWLGFGVGLGLWLYWSVSRKEFIALTLWGVLIVGIAVTWFPNSNQRWTETNSLQWRFKYWQASVELWWEENPLFGTGIWSYRNLVYEAQARLGQRDPSYWDGYVEPKPRRVHNDYLESLNDGGLVYAIAFWGFILFVMKNAYTKGLSRVKAILFCGQIAVLVSALFFFPMRLIDTLMLFFVQLGALCPESS